MRGSIVAAAVWLAACGDLDEATGSSASIGSVSATGEATSSGSGDDGPGTLGGMLQTGSDDGVTTSSGDGIADTTGDGASTDDTTGGDTGPVLGPHDGLYLGTISVTIHIDQTGENVACNGSASINVAQLGSPAVTGTAQCTGTVTNPATIPVSITSNIVGDVTSPTASGTMTSTTQPGGVADDTTWSGTFNLDELDGAFAGNVSFSGYSASYSGTWAVKR